jgi:PAS domain-containing protein
LTSWFSSQSVRYGRIIPAALVVATIGLFAATGLLYRAQSERQELLASTVRTSGWVAYQAQLEYVKADSAIEIALAAPTANALSDLQLRLEILISRLSILYQSEEGQLLRDQQEFQPTMERYEATIGGWLDRLASLAPDAPETKAVIAGWRDELKPLGRELQSILLTSVAYNSEVYRRERELAANPATIPLALMFLSGGGLIGLLFIQNARDRSRLADVMAAQAREAATRANFRAAIEAMPAVIVIFDPHTSKVSFINPAGAALIDPSPDHPEWARLIQSAMSASEAGSYSDLNIGVPRARQHHVAPRFEPRRYLGRPAAGAARARRHEPGAGRGTPGDAVGEARHARRDGVGDRA